ncbi:MAG: alkaline phosphatase family protein [Anaerolineae bacterium]
MTAAQKRVLVIGLDGGTFDLIEPWAAEGHLPNLSRLMSEGCRGYLASTLQPTTAPAWVTFMTGVNQGKHGLYDFVRRRPGGYNLEVTNASHISVPTIFEIASQLDCRVISVNVPHTFPPCPVNGVMIGGPFAPTVTRDLVFPPTYFDEFKKVVPDYFIIPDYDSHVADPMTAFAGKLLHAVELRERLSLYLLQTETWDLFAVVFRVIDDAQHAYWHCQDAPEGSPAARHRHVIRDVYQRVDQAIGAMMAQIAADDQERETVIIVMSDHGFGPFRCMINLNRWLAGAGYLQFRTGSASSLRQLRAAGIKLLAQAYRRYVPTKTRAAVRVRLGARRFARVKGDFESALLTSSVAWDQTRAYVLGAGGNIFINLKGREPAGIVQPGSEYEQLCQEIADALTTLLDPETGRPIVRRVYRREELYDGPFLDQAPDLVVEWKDYAFWGRGRYDSQGAPVFETRRRFDFSDMPLTGSHRLEGILIVNGPGVRPGARVEGARLLDLTPTILGVLGLPIPRYMDGVVLHKAFVNGAIESIVSDSISPSGISSPGSEFAYTPEEETKISQHLQDLGYL